MPFLRATRHRSLPKRRTAGAVAVATGTAVAVLVGFAALEASRFRTVAHTLSDPRLPRSFDGTRLVFLADVHAGPFFGEERVRRLIEHVNALKPDVVVLGGDYVGGHAHGARLFYPHLREMRARLGVLAVLGNHDVWEGEAEARAGLARAGVTLLDNANARLRAPGGDVVIAGLADLWTGAPDPEAAAAGIAPGEFAVLVTHNPDVLADALPLTPRGLYALVLAGHTHGQQLPGAFRLMPRRHRPSVFGKRYLRGWRAEEGTPILISNGVGTVTVPLRLLAPPQIHAITLRSG